MWTHHLWKYTYLVARQNIESSIILLKYKYVYEYITTDRASFLSKEMFSQQVGRWAQPVGSWATYHQTDLPGSAGKCCLVQSVLYLAECECFLGYNTGPRWLVSMQISHRNTLASTQKLKYIFTQNQKYALDDLDHSTIWLCTIHNCLLADNSKMFCNLLGLLRYNHCKLDHQRYITYSQREIDPLSYERD